MYRDAKSKVGNSLFVELCISPLIRPEVSAHLGGTPGVEGDTVFQTLCSNYNFSEIRLFWISDSRA